MSKETQASNPEDYLSKGIIKTHQDEITEWNEKVELLYRYFCKGLTEVECLREVVHVKGYYADISYKSGF